MEEEVLRLFFHGAALVFLLQQRGLYPLHASTVAIDGKAIAISGPSGRGKSTLALALHERGNDFVADDITALNLEGDVPMALPGAPRVRLGPESLATLGKTMDIDDLPRLHPESEKRLRPITKGFSQGVVPLHRIYMLDGGEAGDLANGIEEIAPNKSLIEVLKNGHTAKMIQQAMGPAVHIKQCEQITRQVGIYRVKREDDISSISELARMVEEHVYAEGRASGTAK